VSQPLQYRILGPLEVVRGGRPLSLGGAKQRALLGVLLLHEGEVVGTQRLIDELWGAQPPPSAHKLVQGYVSGLRKVLGNGALETRPHGYVLQIDPGRLDLHEFRRLIDEARPADALALWRGDALADVAFEGAARDEAARLDDLRVHATEERIAAELERGRSGDLVGELEALVREHPYRERFREQLMHALYRAGRQADALAAYRDAHRVLAENLGLEPGPRLRELEAAILRQDDELASPAARVRRTRVRAAAIVAAAAALAVATSAFVLTRPEATVAPPLHLRANAIGLIDPERNAFVAQIPLDSQVTELVLDGKTLWAAQGNDRILVRIDRATRRITGTLGVGSVILDVAVAGGSVWLTTPDPALLRVDPLGMQVLTRIPLSGAPFFVDPRFRAPGVTPRVAVGAGSLWLTNRRGLRSAAGGLVLRLDPETGAVVARIAVPGAPYDIAAGDAGVWIVSSGAAAADRLDAVSPAVSKIDTATNRVGASVKLEIEAYRLAVSRDAVWVPMVGSDALWRIDALAKRRAAVVAVGYHPMGVAVGGDAIWVTSILETAIRRVDPETNRVVATIEPPFGVGAEAADEREVWVALTGA
jgi:DNA-binding SARP family transcriptional activator